MLELPGTCIEIHEKGPAIDGTEDQDEGGETADFEKKLNKFNLLT